MFYVLKETWGPGADPEETPDRRKILFASTLFEAAARIAEQHAERFRQHGSDHPGNRWWARAPDELHVFRVTTSPPPSRSFQSSEDDRDHVSDDIPEDRRSEPSSALFGLRPQ